MSLSTPIKRKHEDNNSSPPNVKRQHREAKAPFSLFPCIERVVNSWRDYYFVLGSTVQLKLFIECMDFKPEAFMDVYSKKYTSVIYEALITPVRLLTVTIKRKEDPAQITVLINDQHIYKKIRHALYYEKFCIFRMAPFNETTWHLINYLDNRCQNVETMVAALITDNRTRVLKDRENFKQLRLRKLSALWLQEAYAPPNGYFYRQALKNFNSLVEISK